jgi:hypothetical protein
MSHLEKAYLDEIDGCFPYKDWGRCVGLIDRGIVISPNAAFGALHEICRPGASADASPLFLMSLLDYWRSRFKHPAADFIAEAASSLIRGHGLTAEDVIAKMRILAPYRAQYAALSILYFSCADPDESVERIDAEIRNSWNDPACSQSETKCRPRA